MDIARKAGRSRLPYVAAATFALIGLGLALAQWQNMRSQRDGLERYLFLSAQSVLLTLETPLLRLSRDERRQPDTRPREMRQGPMFNLDPERRAQFLNAIRDRLSDLEETPAVAMLGIFGEEQGRVISPMTEDRWHKASLPPHLSEILSRDKEWRGVLELQGTPVFFLARPASHPFSSLVREVLELESREHMVFLVVGMDMVEHRAVFRAVRRTMVLQTGFILVAVAVAWWLAWLLGRRKRLAGQALALERLNSLLLDNLPDGLINLSSEQIVLAANPAAHTILETDSMSLAGRSVEELGPERAGIIRGRGDKPSEGEAVWNRAPFKGRELEVASLALPPGLPGEESGPGQLVLIRDRTELRRLEEELSESKRYATVGALAAGVAHEVRNPLSALRGFAQFFARNLAGKEPEERYAQTMVREADRLNRVVGDLLFLAKPRNPEPLEVDLEEVRAELASLLGMDLEEKGVLFKSSLEVRTVFADRDQLVQALINLVLNAAQALSEENLAKGNGRRIFMESRLDPSGSGGVLLTVADNGPGMDQALLDQAFDPFVTGRADGSGLGLAMVGRILRGHGGTARILSEPGRGTRVELLFPAQSMKKGEGA